MPITTRLYDPTTDAPLLPHLGAIHKACIEQDGQALTLLPPLTDAKLTAHWTARAARVTAGALTIVLAFATNDDDVDGSAPTAVLAGCGCLAMPRGSETGPFRGEIEKLLVGPGFRRRGVARRVMGVLEEVAVRQGRWLLMLDTSVGTAAELMYPRLGYKEYGHLPNYAISPITGELMDEKFFYKDLRERVS